jgi:hypothetical protein
MLEAEFLNAGIIDPHPQHVNGQSRFGKRARQFEARHLILPLLLFVLPYSVISLANFSSL